MSELDATTDPTVLVPGDAASLHETAWALGVTADVLREAGDALGRLSTPDGWSGVAADRFRTEFAPQPDRWNDAADAHRTAAQAIEQHAVVVERAQSRAGDAVRSWQVAGVAGADRQEAIHLLDAAREDVRTSGDQAARAVAAARDRAPAGPGVLADAATVAAEVGNAAASLANAALRHPLDDLGLLAGGGLVAVSSVGLASSVALDLTGPGAIAGIPLGGLSAAGLAAGIGLAGVSSIDLALNASGPDRVAPFQVDEDTEAPVQGPAPFPAPTEITGMTKHGDEQAQGRNGGVGVSDEAMADAVANPVAAPEYQLSTNTYKYSGATAVVVLNEEGRVVTTWATNQAGYR